MAQLDPEKDMQAMEIDAGGGATPEPVRALTDGACLGNPGPGGWAVLIAVDGVETVLSGRDSATTNNIMELTAAIRALEATPAYRPLVIVTDSQHVAKGFSEWLPDWRRRGWRTAAGKPVANRKLWERLEALAAGREVRFEWVRGHVGHLENERVDAIANAEAQKAAVEVNWTPAARFGFGPEVPFKRP